MVSTNYFLIKDFGKCILDNNAKKNQNIEPFTVWNMLPKDLNGTNSAIKKVKNKIKVLFWISLIFFSNKDLNIFFIIKNNRIIKIQIPVNPKLTRISKYMLLIKINIEKASLFYTLKFNCLKIIFLIKIYNKFFSFIKLEIRKTKESKLVIFDKENRS